MSLKPLRSAVDAWTPGRGLAADPVHAIVVAWGAIVGADVAAHCRPLEFNGTTLVIATDSSAWSQQLQFLSLSILARIRALPRGIKIERLTFRTGAPRPSERRRAVGTTPARRRPQAIEPVPLAADDLAEAFARLRRRIATLRRAGDPRCGCCDAPLERTTTALCAPCAGEAERERSVTLQRLVYMAPWLTLEDLREQLPGVSSAEFERVRRQLLQRWWLVLERARRSGRLSASRIERHVGSAYVLLQSRLPPDRITPAVVRNLLGTDLEKLLWPQSEAAASTGTRAAIKLPG